MMIVPLFSGTTEMNTLAGRFRETSSRYNFWFFSQFAFLKLILVKKCYLNTDRNVIYNAKLTQVLVKERAKTSVNLSLTHFIFWFWLALRTSSNFDEMFLLRVIINSTKISFPSNVL